MVKKVKVKGLRSGSKLHLFGFAQEGIDIKKIPPYFFIEFDIDLIKPREKEKNGISQ